MSAYMRLLYLNWNSPAGSKTQIAEARMIGWAGTAAIPCEQPVRFADREVIDRGKAAAHQTVPVELPVLVAAGS